MKVGIADASKLATSILKKLGLSAAESRLVTRNLIDAELAGKNTHGLILLPYLKKHAEKLNVDDRDLDVIRTTSNSVYVDGHHKLGSPITYKSLDMALEMVQTAKSAAVGLKNITLTGYIGSYARIATERDLIFIGFNRSSGGLVPFGARKDLWGTNPLTIRIPSNGVAAILDVASSKITNGDVLVAITSGRKIKRDVAIDRKGDVTTDPNELLQGGGLLPFSGYRGSGLAFIVELLGGALTGSGVGYEVAGGRGSFYMLIDPTLFRPLSDFKKDVETAIAELKRAPKMAGFEEIYFAGEQSGKLRQERLEAGAIEIDDDLHRSLLSIQKTNE